MPLRKNGLFSRNTLLNSSMDSVPVGLNGDGYVSSTSLLSNPHGRHFNIGKTVSKRGIGDKSILSTTCRLSLPECWRSLTSSDAAKRCLILSMDLRLVLNAMATRRLECLAWSCPSVLARSNLENFR